MNFPKLEDVFKLSGNPYLYFRKARRISKADSCRCELPGRGLILEGPSGIGKSTGVTKALEELGIAEENHETKRLEKGAAVNS